MYVVTREMVKLAMEMRRLVRCEFGVELRLSQSDLVEQLIHYAQHSADQDLKRLAAELVPPRPVPDEERQALQDATQEYRYYRGALVPVEKSAETESSQPSERSKRSGVVYRGQPLD